MQPLPISAQGARELQFPTQVARNDGPPDGAKPHGDRMWKQLSIVVLIVFAAFHWWGHRSIAQAPGVLAPEAPVQAPARGLKPFEHGGATLTPLAHFDLRARVLGAKRYRFDDEATQAPFDLALGWGRMSDSAVLDRIDISQSNRFYFWRTDHYPIPRQEIISSSANMHIIPADEAVMAKLRMVRRGHVVSLRGYLVMAKGNQGVWISSMTRADSGNGACELFWVESIELE